MYDDNNNKIDLNKKEDGKTIFEEDSYVLIEFRDKFDDDTSRFEVYDKVTGDYLGGFYDLPTTDEIMKNFKQSSLYDSFLNIVDAYYFDDSVYKYEDGLSTYGTKNYNDYGNLGKSYGYYGKDYDSPKEKSQEEIEEEKKLVDSLCKSDTIVFHQEDPTTVMLGNIYEGRGWDVYKGSSYTGALSSDSIHELIKRHNKIVCLGHGSPHGLMSGIIGSKEVPFLKGKKIFALWCYAATFFKNNGFTGQGILCSDNAPSEVWECKAACNADVSAEWIKENITYWSDCLSRYIDLGWTSPKRACYMAKRDYHKSYKLCKTADEKKVVKFNTDTIQVV